jgi:hypothetical protein
MLGVGFPRYAVGVRAPSVWGDLRQQTALPGILFCFAFPELHYSAFQNGKQGYIFVAP